MRRLSFIPSPSQLRSSFSHHLSLLLFFARRGSSSPSTAAASSAAYDDAAKLAIDDGTLCDWRDLLNPERRREAALSTSIGDTDDDDAARATLKQNQQEQRQPLEEIKMENLMMTDSHRRRRSEDDHNNNDHFTEARIRALEELTFHLISERIAHAGSAEAQKGEILLVHDSLLHAQSSLGAKTAEQSPLICRLDSFFKASDEQRK